ncbi:MAG: hypothetical protein K9M45_06915 [Kiritimatiellales bacterium]|nr:hypothetical protein [Kiritimatiellales bacterium]
MICLHCDREHTPPESQFPDLCPDCAAKLEEYKQAINRAADTLSMRYQKGRDGLDIEHVALLLDSLLTMKPLAAKEVVDGFLDRALCRVPEPRDDEDGYFSDYHSDPFWDGLGNGESSEEIYAAMLARIKETAT